MNHSQHTDSTTAEPPPLAPPLFITVRFVDETQSGKCWFEEKLTNGEWVMVPETKMSSEGNARYSLAQVIERRRQQLLTIFRKVGKEEIIPI